MNADDPRHGTTRGFHAGCHAACCRRAIARYEKVTKYRRANGITWAIPAVGVQRRIQALMRLGWTSGDIAEAGGWWHRNCVLRILNGQKGKPCRYVERKTYRTIAEVYERMSMRLPEMTPTRIRTRNLAERKGYAPPLAWDDIDDPSEQPKGHVTDTSEAVDSTIVQRILSGEWRLKASIPERLAVIAAWQAEGRGGLNDLDRRTGWNSRRDLRLHGEHGEQVAS